MKNAIAELAAALDTALTNEPIRRAHDDIAGADHYLEIIKDCRAAIELLESKPDVAVPEP